MIYLFLSGLMVGVLIGKFATDWEWRGNATKIMRKHSLGGLYKVIPDELYDEELVKRMGEHITGKK